MFRRSLTIAAVAVGATLATAMAAYAYPAQTTGDLNVRTGPSVRYARVGVLPRHSVVNVLHCQSRWCQIDFHGRAAWASASYLRGVGVVAPGPVYRYRRAVRPYFGGQVYVPRYRSRQTFRPYYGRTYGRSYRYRRPGVSVYFGSGFGGGWIGF